MDVRPLTGIEALARVRQRLQSRHGLTPEEVAAPQKARILFGFLELAAEKEYRRSQRSSTESRHAGPKRTQPPLVGPLLAVLIITRSLAR